MVMVSTQTIDVVVLARKTRDAYSYPRYGAWEWLRCTEWLMNRGYTAEITEGVLRSKIMRWAADAGETTKPTLEDLKAFFADPANISVVSDTALHYLPVAL